MPLPVPILDDRSYQQLRDELVRRIPAYTPEWTDHNASDPGITLIELFAFLGENLLFRFNQIPESTQLAFLRLLQIPLRPASPARASDDDDGRSRRRSRPHVVGGQGGRSLLRDLNGSRRVARLAFGARARPQQPARSGERPRSARLRAPRKRCRRRIAVERCAELL